MITIAHTEDCCGCSACVQRCPKRCVKMQSDEEGFLYPVVDEKECINCGLCKSVCPIINGKEPSDVIRVYAARHNNPQTVKQSSSGAVFTALAEYTISRGGVVFGARFDDNWLVVHDHEETLDGIAKFRGSKYVQSVIGKSYHEAEEFLKLGRKVLFTGTPCQVAGLKAYLRKEYENLITVDVICHGVPSPLVWRRYVETLCPKDIDGENSVLSLKGKPVLVGLSFRDKTAGWRKYGFSAWYGATEGSDKNTVFPPEGSKKKLEIQQSNVYLRGFLQNLYLRPSCHNCRFRCNKSGSDMTIADFWGIECIFPHLDDDKGMSLVIEKTVKSTGIKLDNVTQYPIEPVQYQQAFKGNSSLFKDDEPNKSRAIFWKEFTASPRNVREIIERYTNYSASQQRRDNLDSVLMRVHLYSLIKNVIRILRRLRK